MVICALSDLVLIVAGVAGIGTVIRQAGWVIDVVRWLGVAFLTAYGVRSLLKARRNDALAAGAPEPLSLRTAVLTATALTWLNPHVYLDTVLLLGSIANTHGDAGRWWFAAGARSRRCCGSPPSASAPGSPLPCCRGRGPGRCSTS